MKKKFKLRIVHWYKEYYKIQYAYYYLIPNWKSIYYWFEYDFTDNLENMSDCIFKYRNAEDFASKIKSIEDIKSYHRGEQDKAKEFYRRKKEYLNKEIPYQKKNII